MNISIIILMLKRQCILLYQKEIVLTAHTIMTITNFDEKLLLNREYHAVLHDDIERSSP